jgi:hypothetical protein
MSSLEKIKDFNKILLKLILINKMKIKWDN